MTTERARQNRTLICTDEEVNRYVLQSSPLSAPTTLENLQNRVFCQDSLEAVSFFPKKFVDLLILDPPYNLTKEYHGFSFRAQKTGEYQAWFLEMLRRMLPCLKETATIYVCSDWRTSTLIFPLLEDFFYVRNRITWEREKGRGARRNWKNNAEDIWFCTVGKEYFFDVEKVKLNRRVVAPYRKSDGTPKDWHDSTAGKFRLTHPSNLWTDITVPFWSMSENTDHPTQKPEKLIAKLILASSREGDWVFDPFAGSGTTAVVAKKLRRHFCAVERNRQYVAWMLKRLELAEEDNSIQGYSEGVFYERNVRLSPRFQEKT
ncbi:MAG: site-specific DNA-methyltransferase [Planctomycetia bacterium]|nr:site-specific DNA-methyltransferase [Planctomycetia bacterium]